MFDISDNLLQSNNKSLYEGRGENTVYLEFSNSSDTFSHNFLIVERKWNRLDEKTVRWAES